jgi:hypothetical protein
MAFQPGSPREHLIGHHVGGLDPHNARSARRERARFVESKQPRARKFFERARLADQTASPRQPPDAERGCKRSGKAYCTRAGNHEHGETDEQCPIERRPLRPAERRQHAEGQNQRDEDADDAVGKALGRTALGQRVSHRSTNLGPSGVRSGTGAPDQERTIHIDTAGDNRGADAFRHRAAFSCYHSFVSVGFALHHRAIEGNAFPWPHLDQRADTNLPHRTARLHAPINHCRAFALRGQQRFKVAGGPSAASRLEIAAYGEQH